MRAPVVAGVSGGVGTTTVAVGLRGLDAGRVAGLPPGRSPDILVCRGTLDSVLRAAAVLDEDGGAPPPVLAVTLTGGTPRGPLRARLDLLDADAAAVVLLPRVRRWITLVDPLAEAAQLLVEPAARLPRPVRAYAGALRELAAAVATSGRLALEPMGEAGGRPTGRPGAGFGPPAHGQPARYPDPDERRARRPGTGFGAPPMLVDPASSRLPVPPRVDQVEPPRAAGPPRRRRGVQIVGTGTNGAGVLAGRSEQAG